MFFPDFIRVSNWSFQSFLASSFHRSSYETEWLDAESLRGRPTESYLSLALVLDHHTVICSPHPVDPMLSPPTNLPLPRPEPYSLGRPFHLPSCRLQVKMCLNSRHRMDVMHRDAISQILKVRQKGSWSHPELSHPMPRCGRGSKIHHMLFSAFFRLSLRRFIITSGESTFKFSQVLLCPRY